MAISASIIVISKVTKGYEFLAKLWGLMGFAFAHVNNLSLTSI